MLSVTKNEKKLLKLIKTVPILIVLIFSIIITYFVINNSIQKHKENIEYIKNRFVNKQKELNKNEVARVVSRIQYTKKSAHIKLQKSLKEKTNTAYNIIMNIYNDNKHKSQNEILKIIKTAIKPIRFNNGRGYFFIDTLKGVKALHPILPHLEGKNLFNIKDKKGTYIFQNILNVCKEKKEGFTEYYWTKPNDIKKQYKKIAFSKLIEPLGLILTTGEYVVDFQKDLQATLLKEIQRVRYGKNGYIFIHQYDGLCLAHIKKENIGKYRLNLQDKKGNFIVQDVINFAKKGAGYLEYIGTINPSTGLAAKKISYIVGLDDWKWQIGAGAYTSDIDKVLTQRKEKFQDKLTKEILVIVFTSILLTLIMIFIMCKLSDKVNTGFKQYKDSLDKEIQKNIKHQKLISEQSKMASMGEMIGNIAHQWRQPLSVISTASTGIIMQKEYGILDEEKLIDTCKAINDNAQYLSRTIDDFRNFIKGDRTKTVFSLQDDIDSFMHLVEGSIKRHSINIILDLEKDIKIDGYKNELIQCFINIFNNAKDALKEKNIQNNRFIFISTIQTNNSIVIQIKDNAGGIPKDIINKIFEPYFTTKHQSQGTGLGLHMTYNLIVDGMGGTIKACNQTYIYDSKEYTGAEFTIELKGDI